MSRTISQRCGASVVALCLGGALLVAASPASVASAATKSNKAPLNVGVAVGLTGYLAPDDVPYSEGVRLAAAYLNKHGGVAGHKVVLHVDDMKSTATTGITVMHQLIEQDHIDAAIGGSVSAATAAYAPLMARSAVPLIAASVLPTDDQWEFSTLQPTSSTDAVDLKWVSQLHAKKIGVVYSETPYGEEASKEMSAAAAALGISVVDSEAAPTTATDLTPQLQKIQSAGAQAIVDVLTGPIHVVEAKSAANSGLKIPIIMGQDTRKIFQESTATYPHTYWTGLASQVYPYNATKKIKAANAIFNKVYKANYHNQPGAGNAARGWDTMQILAQAVRKSGAVTGTKLRNALEHVKYVGTMTRYDYTPSDHTGQLHVPNPLGIGQFDGKKYKIVYQAS